ncbi:MAG: ROK family protein [Patescibacteria group bacterium]
MKKVAIGIDIGGTKTAIGIVDREGHIIARDSIATPSHGDAKKYVVELSKIIKRLINSVKLSGREIEVLGIGIGAPNGNYYKGTIEQANNLSFKGVVPFVKLFKKVFPEFKNIILTNDANAATIGEMIYGNAKGMKNFIMYTLGTGVGCGLVVNGELVYGHDGFAGECGHNILIPEGRLCACGGKGHLEAYCSASGIKRTAFEIMVRDNAKNSLLSNKSFQELDSKIIFEAAKKGDKVALETFEQTGKWLGIALANSVHHTSPEAIFLFGGPVEAGDYIFKPTIKSMEENLLPVFRNKIKVLPSKLKMSDVAIVGASALVWKEITN